jgi:hypothetical protein
MKIVSLDKGIPCEKIKKMWFSVGGLQCGGIIESKGRALLVLVWMER